MNNGMAYTTNELKKGTRVRLRNGWYATLQDNLKGNIRYAEVEGFVTETGSIYSWDIASACINGQWERVELTEKQIKARRGVAGMFGG